MLLHEVYNNMILNTNTSLNSVHDQGLHYRPGGVVYACNPSFIGGRDWEVRNSRPAGVKKLARSYLDK
jgi:hypothetical protein